MRCPAMELGGIAPFVAMFRFESQGKTFVADAVRGWRGDACSAFGHGMPCPYVGNGKSEKNDVVYGAWIARLCCGVTLAQAGMPVLLNAKSLSSEQVSYIKNLERLAAAAGDECCAAALF